MFEDLAPEAAFPGASARNWRRLALAVLRRSDNAGEDTTPEDVDELLTSATYNGIQTVGLHSRDDPPTPPTGLPRYFPYVRGSCAAGGLVARPARRLPS